MTADLDYNVLKFWFDVAQLAGTIGVAVYVWWTSRSRATQESIAAVEASVTGLSGRVDRVEQELEHLPGRSEWQALDTRIDTLNRQIGELTTAQYANNKLLLLINEHLINARKAG